MHDPMTVAFDIKSPIGRRRTYPSGQPYIEHDTWFTIWHVDPESDGSDDSCGWTWRTDPEAQALMDRAEKEGCSEWKFMFGEYGYYMTPLEAIYTTWGAVAWRFFRRRNLMASEICEILSLASAPANNLRHMVQVAVYSEEQCGRLFRAVTRIYLHHHRPWWRHPRWHIHHWKIQWHWLQCFQRWAFSRCAGCGRGFGWGESVIGTQWDSGGPAWFRSERNIYHHKCLPGPRPSEVKHETL